jgi:hypothetical protein
VFKRLFWLLMGVGFGFGVSFWLMRFVRSSIERYTPERVSADLGDALKQFGSDLRAAASEGREAMREREAELRAQLETGRTGGRPPVG